MKKFLAWRVKAPFVAIMSISLCFGQSGQSPKRRVPARNSAPFLQNAESYEETAYVTKLVLKNGMTLVVDEYRTQPVVSVQAIVHAGFGDEPAKSPGLAGLLAAMICRGTGDESVGTFRQQMQTLGGSFRCSADYEKTLFEMTAASSQWKRTLQIQAGALLNPPLDPASLALEAGLAIGEARAVLDNPAEFAREKLLELAFDQPRMANLVAIAAGAPAGLTRESLVEFHKEMYTPGNMMLVVSGDIRASDILNEAVRLYDLPAQRSAKKITPPTGTEQGRLRYRAIRGNVAFPHVLFGFRTVSEKGDDYRALEILNAILGFGNGSVLVTRLRDQKGLILKEQTRLTSYPEFGFLEIDLDIGPRNTDLSEIAALTEIELLKREGPDEADMARAVSQLELSYWQKLETAQDRAQIFARFESLGDWKIKDSYVSELRKVKPSDVRRVANRYLQLTNCSLLEYLPSSGKERNVNVETIQRTFEELVKPSADQEQEERSKETVLPIKIPSDQGSFKFSEIQRPFQLASILRGPEMFIREDHTAPLIDMGIFFPSGRLAEKKENAGITEFMVNMMLRGTKNHGGAHFHRQLEIYGGELTPVVTDDYFGFHFSVFSRNLAEGFDLLREAIKSPDFSEGEIKRQKEIQSALMLESNHDVSYAGQRMNQALFMDFPYSMDSRGTAKSLAGITKESLQTWFDTFVKNRKPIVVAIGDTEGTSLASYFVQHFSGSRMQTTSISADYVGPLSKGESIELSWDNNQSLILIGFQAPPEDDEDGNAAKVLQSFAGGLGLFSQEIRDRLGIAYDVSVTYKPRLRGGSLVACAAPIQGKEDAVLKSLREEIARLTAGPIADRDFRSAVNAAIGACRIRNQYRISQIEDIVENVLAGKGLEGYQNQVSGFQGVTEEDLGEVARRIFRMDKAVILVVHGQSRW